jgi:hypothetical protein
MSSRLVLIGLDGATFTVLDPPMEGGSCPCSTTSSGTKEAIVLMRLHAPGYLE